MTTVVDQLGINLKKTILDLTLGTIVPGIIENVFGALQSYFTRVKIFSFLGVTDDTNATLVRIFRLLLEPPVVLTSLYFAINAFLGSDIDSAPSIFLAIVLFGSMSRYLGEVVIVRNTFTTFVIGAEQSAEIM